MALELKRRRFTVAEYYQMARAGILGEDDRVELIEGEIVEMVPIGPRHASCVDRLTERFLLTFRDVARVRTQHPIRLSEYSEPEPDLALVRRRLDYYTAHHPTPEDVFLLVEVAETSAPLDRRAKIPLYARSGIPEVWLVDLKQVTITVYREPTPSGYRTAQVARRGERLAPLAFPDHELAVADMLG